MYVCMYVKLYLISLVSTAKADIWNYKKQETNLELKKKKANLKYMTIYNNVVKVSIIN